MRDVKREEIATEWVCEKCGKPMVIKWGRNGSVPGVPGLSRVPQHEGGRQEPRRHVGEGPDADHRRGLRDLRRADDDQARPVRPFLACTRYPDCKTTKPISLGVKCPRPGCGGFIAEKRSRRGKPFYGCSNWAKKQCDFVAWDKPIPQPCPICNAQFVVQEGEQGRHAPALPKPECDYTADGEAEGGEAPPANSSSTPTGPASSVG